MFVESTNTMYKTHHSYKNIKTTKNVPPHQIDNEYFIRRKECLPQPIVICNYNPKGN